MIKIGTNISSLSAQRRLAASSQTLDQYMERLSSGQRINHAADDAAGLAISMGLNSKARVQSRAVLNVNDALSYLRIAEGALDALQTISVRQRELATQAASGSYSTSQRAAMDREARQLTDEYTRIVEGTQFNGARILQNSSSVRIQFGSGLDESLMLGSIAPPAAGGDGTTTTEIVSVPDGTFAAWQSAGIAPGGSYDAALADLNGDTHLDLAIPEFGANRIEIWYGDGNGAFSYQANYPVTLSNAVAVGDLNGDSRPDLAISSTTDILSIRLQQANGTFGVATTYAEQDGEIALADFNGDGKLDVATPGTGGIMVRFGAGDGTFGAASSYGAMELDPKNLVVGDVDGDGDTDIVAAHAGDYFYGSEIRIFRNSGGSFNTQSTISGYYDDLLDNLVLADFDNDGDDDLAATNLGWVRAWRSRGDGTFDGPFSYAVGTTDHGLAAADLNGDNFTDLVTTPLNGGRGSYILLGTGTGTFTPSISYPGQQFGEVRIGDINEDGLPDIVGIGVNIYTQLGQGTTSEITVTSPSYLDLQSADGARSAMVDIDERLASLDITRGNIGVLESRLSFALGGLIIGRENNAAAASRITSADIAHEAAGMIRSQITRDVASSILAQANSEPQIALLLLRT